jgi:hypothetical protein
MINEVNNKAYIKNNNIILYYILNIIYLYIKYYIYIYYTSAILGSLGRSQAATELRPSLA